MQFEAGVYGVPSFRTISPMVKMTGFSVKIIGQKPEGEDDVNVNNLIRHSNREDWYISELDEIKELQILMDSASKLRGSSYEM